VRRWARAFAIAGACAACGAEPAARGPAPVPEAAAPRRPIAAAPAVSTAPLSDASIYDLDLELVDQGGRAIGLDAGRGGPVLIAMFYASCPAACPRLIDAVGEVVDAMPAARRAATRVLLVSFDAAHDTPERLAALAAAHRLDPTRWTLAAATPDDARLLAAVLGIKYRPLADGQFFHTSVITALDADGRPIARLDGLGDVAPLVAALP
jgi:protein SCO1